MPPEFYLNIAGILSQRQSSKSLSEATGNRQQATGNSVSFAEKRLKSC
jgi:hypothetical protein